MSCVRFRINLTGADFTSAPPASASSVGEVDFRSLVNEHTTRPSSSSGSSSRPAKRVKTTLVSSKTGEPGVASSSSSSSMSAAGGQNERSSISSGALDLSAYDNMPLDSVIGSGHRHGGGLTSVIEKIERSYANPLYFMPSSSEEDDSMESNNSDENDIEDDDGDDDDGDINLDDSGGHSTGKGLSNIFENVDEAMAASGNASTGGKTVGKNTMKKDGKKKKRKKSRKVRRVDYYSDDSFIDDSELLDEKERFFELQQSKTRHGGFFVNAGDILVQEDEVTSTQFSSQSDMYASEHTRPGTQTGDKREDFIIQHIGRTWDGHNSELQAELEMFVQRARPIIQNCTLQATPRLPQVLEGPLTHLDKIIRESTSAKQRRRPWPYIAALMDALPGFSKTRVMKTLSRLKNYSEAQQALHLAQAAKDAIQRHLEVRLNEHDAFAPPSASADAPEAAGSTRISKQYNWIPKTQMLLYVAVMRLRNWVAKENHYRERLEKADLDALGWHADEQVDLKKETDALLTDIVSILPDGMVEDQDIRSHVALGKILHEESEKTAVREKKERAKAEKEIQRLKARDARRHEKAMLKAAAKKKREEEREKKRREKALAKAKSKQLPVSALDKKIAAFTKKNGPRKVRRAYNFFQKHIYAKLIVDEPELQHLPQERMKRIGQLWQMLGDDERKKWDAKTQDDKVRYENEFAAFKLEKLDPFVQKLTNEDAKELNNSRAGIRTSSRSTSPDKSEVIDNGSTTGNSNSDGNSSDSNDNDSNSSNSQSSDSASSSDDSGDDSDDDTESVKEATFQKRMKEFLKMEAPKRSANSFMLFATEQRPLLMRERPELSVQQLSRKLGERWRSMSEEAKKMYKEDASAKRAAYNVEMKNFESRRATFENELRTQLGLDPQTREDASTNKKVKKGFGGKPIMSRNFHVPEFLDDDFEGSNGD
eukprot:g4951.t1